jgi:hypothetical protein
MVERSTLAGATVFDDVSVLLHDDSYFTIRATDKATDKDGSRSL